VAANQVSGPGPLSARTDIGNVQKTRDLPNADYGEQQAYQAQQQGAPLAGDSGQAPGGAGGNPAAANVIPMGAPTQRPGEPVTSGANSGAGPDAQSLGLPNQQGQDMTALKGYLPVFEFMANQPGASWSARNLVRSIKAAGVGST
jgi:hypothetical protein